MSPLTLAHRDQRGWMFYMLNLINTEMNQYQCHCHTAAGLDYLLQDTWQFSSPIITTTTTRPSIEC